MKNAMTSVSLPAQLFRALPDMAGDEWCLELRDGGRKLALWWIMEQGIRPFPLKIAAESPWNLTLLDFFGGICVMGRYSRDGMPVLQGIEAVDRTGRQIWYYPEGKSLRRNESHWEVSWKDEIRKEPLPQSDISPPAWYSPGLFALPESFRSVLSSLHPSGTLLNQMERVDSGKRILLSCFFQETDAKVFQYFVVLGSDHSILFSDCIQKNMKGLSLDIWSVKGDKVFLMRNHQEWCVIDL